VGSNFPLFLRGEGRGEGGGGGGDSPGIISEIGFSIHKML